MKTLTVVAAFQSLPGKEVALREALMKLVAPTRRETGCINYDLHQSTENPAKFLFHENWTSKAHLDAHLATPHIAELKARLDELCVAPPEITLWDKIA